MEQGMYYELYNMLAEFIYGNGAVLTGEQTLTLTLIATFGALFVIAIPFYCVWRALRLFL